MFVMGIDAGNYDTKVCTEQTAKSFPSDIGEYRERKLTDNFSNDDIIWEYNNEKGFAGTLARYESEFGGTIKGKTKANKDAVLRVLIAVHKYGKQNNNIVIGQPIDAHYDTEKNKLKDMLKGKHIIKVNGAEKELIISNVEIAPEGASSILSNPVKGLIRIIDIGSGTTNFATLYNLKRVDKGSFTEQIGTEITRNKEPKEMANKLHRIISANWDNNDTIFLTGGGAEKVISYLKETYNNCSILKPRLNNSILSTRYSNAVAFYIIAKGLYSNEEKEVN